MEEGPLRPSDVVFALLAAAYVTHPAEPRVRVPLAAALLRYLKLGRPYSWAEWCQMLDALPHPHGEAERLQETLSSLLSLEQLLCVLDSLPRADAAAALAGVNPNAVLMLQLRAVATRYAGMELYEIGSLFDSLVAQYLAHASAEPTLVAGPPSVSEAKDAFAAATRRRDAEEARRWYGALVERHDSTVSFAQRSLQMAAVAHWMDEPAAARRFTAEAQNSAAEAGDMDTVAWANALAEHARKQPPTAGPGRRRIRPQPKAASQAPLSARRELHARAVELWLSGLDEDADQVAGQWLSCPE